MKRLFGGICWDPDRDARTSTMLELDMPSAAMRIVELDAQASIDKLLKLFVNRQVTVVSVNVPFSWPSAFSKIIAAWTPNQCSYLVPSLDDFQHRMTDLFVKSEIIKRPAASATECLNTYTWVELSSSQGLQKQIDLAGSLTDDDGRPTIIETDHIATLCGMNVVTALEHMPDFEQQDVRRDRITKTLDVLKIRHNEKHLESLVSDFKLSKSFLAAVTSIIYWCEISDTVDGATVIDKFGFGIHKPNAEQLETAKKEGWIYFPRRV